MTIAGSGSEIDGSPFGSGAVTGVDPSTVVGADVLPGSAVVSAPVFDSSSSTSELDVHDAASSPATMIAAPRRRAPDAGAPHVGEGAAARG